MLCKAKLILFDLLLRMYTKFGRNNVIYIVFVNLFDRVSVYKKNVNFLVFWSLYGIFEILLDIIMDHFAL